MKIEITSNNGKYAVERKSFDAETAFDDFLNLLFISGVDIKELETIIKIGNERFKKNHKTNESKTIQSSSHL